ncbi:alpha/beta hydrolase [Tenacibaculum geojense]|uniref:Alpha/beta hydrolase n=1 Tax=Tenacibaculum geojense TaxID=915352 RepID=A0ABW3JN18_9FLAO
MKLISLYICVTLVIFSCKKKSNNTIELANNQVENTLFFKELTSIKLAGGKLYRADSITSKYIKSRPIDVWVPNDYSSTKKYSVLYMHDGQMLFDASTTWNKQEWKVDEWATDLQNQGKVNDFIVVAIHNIPKIRWQDLFPQKAFNYIEESIQKKLKSIAGNKDFTLNGDNYLSFLTKELKPIIDQQYPVLTDQNNTFIMGSSMGGLMSMYAVSEYPEIFGGAACLSTHWVGAMPMDDNPFPDAIFNYMADNLPESGNHKLYFDYGNKTLDAHYPKYAPIVDRILSSKGYDETNSKNLFFEGTDHSENSWNSRLNEPLLFLLGN